MYFRISINQLRISIIHLIHNSFIMDIKREQIVKRHPIDLRIYIIRILDIQKSNYRYL